MTFEPVTLQSQPVFYGTHSRWKTFAITSSKYWKLIECGTHQVAIHYSGGESVAHARQTTCCNSTPVLTSEQHDMDIPVCHASRQTTEVTLLIREFHPRIYYR